MAEAMAAAADPAEHERLAARYDHLQHELHRHDAYNLDHKIERVLDGLGFRRETLRPAGRIAQRRRAEPPDAGQAAAGRAEPDAPGRALQPPRHRGHRVARRVPAGKLGGDDRGQPRPLLPRQGDQPHAGAVPRHGGQLHAATSRPTGSRRPSGCWSSGGPTRSSRSRSPRPRSSSAATPTARSTPRPRTAARSWSGSSRCRRRGRSPRRRWAFPRGPRAATSCSAPSSWPRRYDRPLFADVDFEIIRGQRWALLGPNGCGKTTLLRCLLGLVPPDAGHGRRSGQGVEVGYFDQQLAELDDDMPVVDAVRPQHKQFEPAAAARPAGPLRADRRHGACRRWAASAAASGAARPWPGWPPPTPISSCSTSRPTTSISGPATPWNRPCGSSTAPCCSSATTATSSTAWPTTCWWSRGTASALVEGNYETYQQLLGRKRAEATEESAPQAAARPAPRTAPSGAAPRAKRKFPYRKLADIEDEIFQREACIEKLHRQLAHGETYRNGQRVRQIMAEVAEQQEALKILYEHWEEAAELNW